MGHGSRPLRVGLVIEQLWQPVPGGSATYIRGLAAALARRDDVEVVGVRARARQDDDSGDVVLPVPVVASRLPRSALYESWSRLRRPALRGGPFDVVHATTWAIPRRSAPLVVTVHDLAFLRSPDHFTRRGVAYFRHALTTARTDADLVVVPSHATLVDCVDAGFDPGRVHVIPHGVDVPPVAEAAVARFLRDHDLRRDFVLWCGTLEPRKNLTGVVRAFARLLSTGADLDLVVVGPQGWGGVTEELRREAALLPAGRVHHLGRLDETDLHAAYAAARALCFPSFWEGFGLPVLEAMAHGTPVVTSAGTSMAEIAATGGAVLCDPLDEDQIAEALARATGPDHDRLSRAALATARTYTWTRAAQMHAEVYREAVVRARRGEAS